MPSHIKLQSLLIGLKNFLAVFAKLAIRTNVTIKRDSCHAKLITEFTDSGFHFTHRSLSESDL